MSRGRITLGFKIQTLDSDSLGFTNQFYHLLYNVIFNCLNRLQSGKKIIPTLVGCSLSMKVDIAHKEHSQRCQPPAQGY